MEFLTFLIQMRNQGKSLLWEGIKNKNIAGKDIYLISNTEM